MLQSQRSLWNPSLVSPRVERVPVAAEARVLQGAVGGHGVEPVQAAIQEGGEKVARKVRGHLKSKKGALSLICGGNFRCDFYKKKSLDTLFFL